jgi:hypothetical protein
MRIRKLLGLKKSGPKLIKRIRARAYPFTPSPRAFAQTQAGQKLIGLFEQNRGGFERLCRAIAADVPKVADLQARVASPDNPHWVNGYLPPLDGMIIYTQLGLLKPRTYLEIGSGTSTKFARKAIRDFGLQTKIISIDPTPRAEIDALCDEVIRAPFQNIGEKILAWLQPGDMLFQDGSHHVFTNTDATVFFNEVLPVLPAGITYGIHDIFLPDDYPVAWHKRFYNEQYLWASYLLAGAGGDEIVFPVYFISRDPALAGLLEPLFKLPELDGLSPHGGAFWMKSGASRLA